MLEAKPVVRTRGSAQIGFNSSGPKLSQLSRVTVKLEKIQETPQSLTMTANCLLSQPASLSQVRGKPLNLRRDGRKGGCLSFRDYFLRIQKTFEHPHSTTGNGVTTAEMIVRGLQRLQGQLIERGDSSSAQPMHYCGYPAQVVLGRTQSIVLSLMHPLQKIIEQWTEYGHASPSLERRGTKLNKDGDFFFTLERQTEFQNARQ